MSIWTPLLWQRRGASGADLANIVNEAALRAVRMNRKLISQEDLFESVEVIIAGQQRKNHIMSREEREIVAFHEIGHGACGGQTKRYSADSEDYDYSENIRRFGLYDADAVGGTFSYEKTGNAG